MILTFAAFKCCSCSDVVCKTIHFIRQHLMQVNLFWQKWQCVEYISRLVWPPGQSQLSSCQQATATRLSVEKWVSHILDLIFIAKIGELGLLQFKLEIRFDLTLAKTIKSCMSSKWLSSGSSKTTRRAKPSVQPYWGWPSIDLSLKGTSSLQGKKSGESHSLTRQLDMGEVCCSTQGACRQSHVSSIPLNMIVYQDGCVGNTCSEADSSTSGKRWQGGGGVCGEDWELLPQVWPQQEGHAQPGWVLQCDEAAEWGGLHKRGGDSNQSHRTPSLRCAQYADPCPATRRVRSRSEISSTSTFTGNVPTFLFNFSKNNETRLLQWVVFPSNGQEQGWLHHKGESGFVWLQFLAEWVLNVIYEMLGILKSELKQQQQTL